MSKQAHLCIERRGNVVEHKFCVWSEHDRAVITRLTIVIVFRGYQSSFGRYAVGRLSMLEIKMYLKKGNKTKQDLTVVVT